MPQYKLHYFDSPGRAEVVRLMFALKGIEYKDIRYSVEEWPTKKDMFPLRQVPVLEVDGYMLLQSCAIARYVAKELGLHGSSNRDQAQIDAVVDTVEEFYTFGSAMKDAAAQKAYLEEKVPGILKRLEVLLERNTEGQDYFLGNSMTLADLSFAQGVQCSVYLKAGEHFNMEKHPKLQAVYDRVKSEPNIAAWIAKRPVSDLEKFTKGN